MRFALVLLAIVGTALATPSGGSRIVGGTPVDISRYPFTTNLEYSWFAGFWSHGCGGSLVRANSVLSAAHCFIGDPASRWRARFGSSWAGQGVLYTASALIIHPGYSNVALDPDIAIVRLSQPVSTSPSIGLASIAGTNYNLNDGAIVTAIGWGATRPGGPVSPDLQHVDVNVINQRLCADRYAELKTQPGFQNWPDITPGMFCAGILDVGGKDACQGDSGGPVVHNNVVVGVTSWGYSCAHPVYPGVKARVSAYAQWIVANA